MIALHASLCIHTVFHVSLFKKYIPNANHIIYWNVIQVEPESKFQVAPESIHGVGKGPMDLVQS
jgi:hypothetical protein